MRELKIRFIARMLVRQKMSQRTLAVEGGDYFWYTNAQERCLMYRGSLTDRMWNPNHQNVFSTSFHALLPL